MPPSGGGGTVFLLALRLCAQHNAWCSGLTNDLPSRAQLTPPPHLERWDGKVIKSQVSGYIFLLSFIRTMGLGVSHSVSQLPHLTMEFVEESSGMKVGNTCEAYRTMPATQSYSRNTFITCV